MAICHKLIRHIINIQQYFVVVRKIEIKHEMARVSLFVQMEIRCLCNETLFYAVWHALKIDELAGKLCQSGLCDLLV